ncbi:alternative ribosome rescue aminoacyl-tRNA hydrolase ArfB [Treponema brennaborense]|uniref:Class I peptide chain release factor n=1 Tax=Treponema brennaborense (strain DSM 12168 / CIP 105900 / DD5/3) TaxID=906968 RepID=F4LKJ8_TREBD|nr:alternative ribosome rescue aminoacyl-tRNA hydrolase ArfB [Treponema brennaborense]AEE17554.1 Class I peptide chain release factor [Treponema brennaborense DSM 12168]
MNRAEIRQSILEQAAFSFSRSGGPGGQNINKLNTKVHASVPLAELRGLSEAERAQVAFRLKNKITQDGCLCVAVQDERVQERNRQIALDRLEQLVVQAAVIPKKRKKTKPSLASRERRLQGKKLRGALKRNRSCRLDG